MNLRDDRNTQNQIQNLNFQDVVSHRSLAHPTSDEVPKTNPYLMKHMQHTAIKDHPLLITYNLLAQLGDLAG